MQILTAQPARNNLRFMFYSLFPEFVVLFVVTFVPKEFSNA